MTSSTPIHIVRLDGVIAPSPIFPPSFPHTYTEHPTTSLDPSETTSRLLTANVAITTTIPITRATLLACPALKLICAMSIGTNHIDLETCSELGVTVCNVPAASNESVAEHALSFYFALRRRTVVLHELVAEGREWSERGSLKEVLGKEAPMGAREEVVGIVGGGELGNRVANLCRALNMTVHLLDRKPTPPSTPRADRIPFHEGLRQSTIVILTLPFTPTTHNLISTPELSLMRPDSLLINVARGGIVDESALVEALKAGKIMGTAADVFVTEPATRENSPLVKAAGEEWARGRVVLSPHLAWCAGSSVKKLRETVVGNVLGWEKGEARNVVRWEG